MNKCFIKLFSQSNKINVFLYLFLLIISIVFVSSKNNFLPDFRIKYISSQIQSNFDNFFLEPYLFPGEKSMLYRYMDQSRVFFEFGSGGSTHQAAKRRLKIFSAEIGPAWHDQIRSEFKEIKEKISNDKDTEPGGFDIDITYLLVDLQSKAEESFDNKLKYVKLYDHRQYQADLILIDKKYKFSCLMNVFKEIGNSTFVFIHELNAKDDYVNLTKYFDIIEKVDRSFILRKKYPPPILSEKTLEFYEKKEIKSKNKVLKRIDFVRKNLFGIVERYRYSNNSNMIKPNIKQIWVFWWTGLETAPPIVKMCVTSLQRNFNGGTVTIITQDNYLNFTTIPPYVIEKLNSHKFKIVHFTDIYRTSLLASKGGMWVDATIFVNKEISSNWFSYPYYTIHFDDSFDLILGKWCGFIQSSFVNCIVTKFCSEMLITYWEKFDNLIHYFLIDYIMMIGYDYIPAFNRLIQAVPLNNGGVHDLYNHMNDEFSEELFQSIWKSSGFFKLTWKKEIKTEINGHKTIFGYIQDKVK